MSAESFEWVLDMDPLDKALLWELFGNARISYQDLATKYQQSFNTIKNRIKKLENAGAIQEYTVELSRAMLDLESIKVVITTDGSEDINALLDQIGNHRQIRFFYRAGPNRYEGLAYLAGATEFFEFKQSLESLKAVLKVEIHPIAEFVPDAPPDSKARSAGSKITFSKNQLRVLRCLIGDVRMAIGEIAKQTGITPRRVSKILSELQASGGVHFTIRMNFHALGDIELEYVIQYDDEKTTPKEVIDWVYQQYKREFWHALHYLDEPTVIINLITEDTTRIKEITKRMREIPFVKTITDYLIPQLHRGGHYRDPTEHHLEEMIKEAEL
jgi:DNA-binding Lrp family transcriptional regulator